MVNLERKRPRLILAVANPSAEEWLRGEVTDYMDVYAQPVSSPDDLFSADADVILTARRGERSDVGIEDFVGMLEASTHAGMDVIAIVGDLDDGGKNAASKARELNAWATLISDETGEGVGGEEVLGRLLAYLDDWKARKKALESAKGTDEEDVSPKRRIPLFGASKPAIPDGRIIGVTSAGGCGGTMLAWNLATALAGVEGAVALINAVDPTLSVWTNLRETRSTVLKGAGEDAVHYGVKVGVADRPMSDEDWVLAARLSMTQRVIVDLTKMSEPPLDRIETLIHVRDVDPAHVWTPTHNHRRIVINRVPDDLPIEPEDVLQSTPSLKLAEYHNQVIAAWTGRPVVLDIEGMAEQLVSLLGSKEALQCTNRLSS